MAGPDSHSSRREGGGDHWRVPHERSHKAIRSDPSSLLRFTQEPKSSLTDTTSGCNLRGLENTVFGKAYTPNGSDNNNVDLATTVLRIQSSGPSEHRTLVLRVDTSDSSTPKIFDARLNSFDLGSTSTVFVDQVDLLAFEDLTPHLQDVIIGMAKVAFQRRMQGNLNMDTALMQEYAQAEAQIERNIADISSQPFNQRPMVPGMGQPQQQRER